MTMLILATCNSQHCTTTGALLAEMWTGSVLFGCGNAQSVLARIIAITCKGKELPPKLMTRAGVRAFFSPSGSLFEMRSESASGGKVQGGWQKGGETHKTRPDSCYNRS